MKNQFRTCFTIILIASLQTVFLSSNAQNASKNPSITGTYIYELEGQEGMCIITKMHYTFVLTAKDRKPFQGSEPSETEKAAAFSSTIADGGTYKFVGAGKVLAHRLYSTNPQLAGKEFTFEYEFDGDLLKYWVLQEDGSRGPMGKARRISK